MPDSKGALPTSPLSDLNQLPMRRGGEVHAAARILVEVRSQEFPHAARLQQVALAAVKHR